MLCNNCCQCLFEPGYDLELVLVAPRAFVGFPTWLPVKDTPHSEIKRIHEIHTNFIELRWGKYGPNVHMVTSGPVLYVPPTFCLRSAYVPRGHHMSQNQYVRKYYEKTNK